jgi:hypothetical protein
MGNRYTAPFEAVTVTTADEGVVLVTSDATVRPAIYDLTVGIGTTPADQTASFQLVRTTTTGTGGTATAPSLLDPASPAASAISYIGTFSAEPTVTTATGMLMWAMNTRATFRWVAAPGSELIVQDASANGILLNPSASPSTINPTGSILWTE